MLKHHKMRHTLLTDSLCTLVGSEIGLRGCISVTWAVECTNVASFTPPPPLPPPRDPLEPPEPRVTREIEGTRVHEGCRVSLELLASLETRLVAVDIIHILISLCTIVHGLWPFPILMIACCMTGTKNSHHE